VSIQGRKEVRVESSLSATTSVDLSDGCEDIPEIVDKTGGCAYLFD
jgi:hypothetical protein